MEYSSNMWHTVRMVKSNNRPMARHKIGETVIDAKNGEKDLDVVVQDMLIPDKHNMSDLAKSRMCSNNFGLIIKKDM